MGFPVISVVKNSPKDMGLIPGLGRSLGKGNGNPLQYSCQGNPMDRGAWWTTVHGVEKSQTWLSSQNSLKLNCEAGPKMTPPTASTGHRHCSLSRAGHQTLMSEQLLPLLRYEHCFYYSQNGSCAVFPFTSFSTKFGTCKEAGEALI